METLEEWTDFYPENAKKAPHHNWQAPSSWHFAISTQSREFKSKLIEINESNHSDLSICLWAFGKDVKGTYLNELIPLSLVKLGLLVAATISWDSAGYVRQVWAWECKRVRGALLTHPCLLELLLPVL